MSAQFGEIGDMEFVNWGAEAQEKMGDEEIERHDVDRRDDSVDDGYFPDDKEKKKMRLIGQRSQMHRTDVADGECHP